MHGLREIHQRHVEIDAGARRHRDRRCRSFRWIRSRRGDDVGDAGGDRPHDAGRRYGRDGRRAARKEHVRVRASGDRRRQLLRLSGLQRDGWGSQAHGDSTLHRARDGQIEEARLACCRTRHGDDVFTRCQHLQHFRVQSRSAVVILADFGGRAGQLEEQVWIELCAREIDAHRRGCCHAQSEALDVAAVGQSACARGQRIGGRRTDGDAAIDAARIELRRKRQRVRAGLTRGGAVGVDEICALRERDCDPRVAPTGTVVIALDGCAVALLDEKIRVERRTVHRHVHDRRTRHCQRISIRVARVGQHASCRGECAGDGGVGADGCRIETRGRAGTDRQLIGTEIVRIECVGEDDVPSRRHDALDARSGVAIAVIVDFDDRARRGVLQNQVRVDAPGHGDADRCRSGQRQDVFVGVAAVSQPAIGAQKRSGDGFANGDRRRRVAALRRRQRYDHRCRAGHTVRRGLNGGGAGRDAGDDAGGGDRGDPRRQRRPCERLACDGSAGTIECRRPELIGASDIHRYRRRRDPDRCHGRWPGQHSAALLAATRRETERDHGAHSHDCATGEACRAVSSS